MKLKEGGKKLFSKCSKVSFCTLTPDINHQFMLSSLRTEMFVRLVIKFAQSNFAEKATIMQQL